VHVSTSLGNNARKVVSNEKAIRTGDVVAVNLSTDVLLQYIPPHESMETARLVANVVRDIQDRLLLYAVVRCSVAAW
jgi:hypothetical protein